MIHDTKPRRVPRRITLDGQLVSYWEREALRLEGLAARSSWRWLARRYGRRAADARARAQRSQDRETARIPPAADAD